jgi:putative oxidoreductase
MKIFNIILRIVFCLVLLLPILGVIGIFPPATPDLYNTPQAFAFINMLAINGYIPWIIAIVFAISIILTIMNRMALAALLIVPITVNIISFHLFLDGGLFTSGAILADILLLLNAYFLWQNWGRYKVLWNK